MPTRRLKKQNTSYRERLLEEFGEKEYENLTKSFDLVGNIAVIDVEKGYARKVAKIIMETHKNVETVLRKGGAVKGKYRTREYLFVLGKRNYIARYKENGSTFLFDIRKVFFSARLAYERKRVSDLSKNGEKVIVMFAGIGPFAIEAAKGKKDSKILAIEMNRHAYGYLLENIKINKLKNVVPILSDAGLKERKYKGFADRIIMPLPKDAYEFLESAFFMAGKRCVIHYYAFVEDEKKEVERVREFALRHKHRFRLLGSRVVRPYSSTISEIALDFEIS